MASLLLATIFMHALADASNVNDTNLVYQNPILKYNDPVLTNDSDEMLGICYGQNTQWITYPYIVQIRGSCSCSGSIIDMGSGSRAATILTAAHCANCAQTVYVGCNNPSNCVSQGESYPVALGSFTTWGYQNPSQFSNDIAILRTTRPITYDGARSVQINTNANNNPNVNRITGYGIDQTRSTPTQLQTASTQYVANNVCNSRLSGVTIEGNMICVENDSTPSNPGASVCSGDSGGPWTGSDGVQYGVTSFGLAALVGGCGQYDCRCCPDSPQVGARVSVFANQICSAIANNNPGC